MRGTKQSCSIVIRRDCHTTWQKSLGGTGVDVAFSIQETSDGHYIITGFSGSTDGDVTSNHGYYDIWVVKIDANGDL
ncbi:MAG: hypothetical protein GY816_10350 [Cytophagales bacterium]|nr:hypothetical protein [Cytophagales bacterium]